MGYRAFFSYARADDKIANWLHRALDGYRTPKPLIAREGALGAVPAKLHPIFRDRTDLQAGGHVDASLQQALEESETLIVLCTPTSAKSRWVNHECETFLNLARANRIFPVIAAGEPDSGDPDTECFPPALRGKGLLAADLREIRLPSGQLIGDGKEGGRLKLIAGLLGVSLDDLVRRERRRQRQLILSLGVAAVVFAAVAVAAGGFWWQAEQRGQTIAQQASELSETNTQLSAQLQLSRRLTFQRQEIIDGLADIATTETGLPARIHFLLAGSRTGLSMRALELLFRYEVGDEANYEQSLSAPQINGLSQEGVRIGFNYDLKDVSAEEFATHWSRFLPEDHVARLKAFAGLSGAALVGRAAELSDIRVPYSAAVSVFGAYELPRRVEEIHAEFAHSEDLHPDAQGALISLVANCGLSGGRLDSIRTLAREQRFDAIPEAIQSACIPAQLPSIIRRTIAARREAEAALFQSGLDKAGGP